ncbi:MAG: hypothetical protein CMC08_01910 [Flavobacteriaceae bacterium]|nr:hypothetical protein [Flavobacteriaceae bacterium]
MVPGIFIFYPKPLDQKQLQLFKKAQGDSGKSHRKTEKSLRDSEKCLSSSEKVPKISIFYPLPLSLRPLKDPSGRSSAACSGIIFQPVINSLLSQ